MKFSLMLLSVLLAFACKTTQSSKTSSVLSSANPLPSETQKLWDSYVASLANKKLQSDCNPILSPSKQGAKGLVVIYHGFTGCPVQFTKLANELNEQGYHVLMPLLPGNGRVPERDQEKVTRLEAEQGKEIWKIIGEGNSGEVLKDDFSDIPQNVQEYYDYAEQMTAIAKSFPGERIIVGLSLGGGLSVATLLKGVELADSPGGNVWDRSLIYTPFFKAPSIQGHAANVIGKVLPGFGFGFGAGCESEQLRTDYARRKGICDFAIGNIRTLQVLGSQVGKKDQMAKIKVPVQVLGVANDNTSDNTSIINAFNFSQKETTKVCFYPDEVGHATVISGDYVPLNSSYENSLATAREANNVPRITRFWARDVYDRSIKFITSGFSQDGGPFLLSDKPSSEKNKEAKACELNVNIAETLSQNQKLCAEGKADSVFCQDLPGLAESICSPDSIDSLPADSVLKTFCQK